MKYYAGIGSRNTPKILLPYIKILTEILYIHNYVLRSGGAKGADSMFENSLNSIPNINLNIYKDIFYSNDAEIWSFIEVLKHFPNDREKGTFNFWKPYVKGLMARNMMQVLGKNNDKRVDFVVCWTPVNYYNNSDCGGTGYAIRCALAYNIPIFNFIDYKNPKKLIYDVLKYIK